MKKIVRIIIVLIKSVLALPCMLLTLDLFHVMRVNMWRFSKEEEDLQVSPEDSLHNTKQHLVSAIDWILNAQRVQPDGGVTAWYTLFLMNKKSGSYPEVTGYIIPTMFDCAKKFDDTCYFESAVKMADFECSIQLEDGAFQGGPIGVPVKRSVFNSAQVLHGLIRTYKETDEEKYLSAAIRVADWIVSKQNDDGSWSEGNYLGVKRVYDTKVAEPLVELYLVTNNDGYKKAAIFNLEYVLIQQKDNGWFENCDNSTDRNNEPLTHTIGYTVQGLMECGVMLGEQKYIDVATKTLDVLLRKFELRKDLLPGRYDSQWKGTVKSSCVTGNAQISICWSRLYQLTGEIRYFNAALKMNNFLKEIQYEQGSNAIRGAVASSYPIWGDYGAWRINSWGNKYYIDALLLEYEIKTQILNDCK